MVDINLGCAGWDYKDWIGPFYPKKLEPHEHLNFYAKYFNIVEINNTFYNLPSEEIVQNWYNRTPDDFRFVVKVWQNITHKLNEDDIDYYISEFFNTLEVLDDKLSCFLLQFPPWFHYSEKHLKQLEYLLGEAPSDFNHVIELRDDSWFDPQIIDTIIDKKRITLGTTYIPKCIPFYLPDQHWHYIRMIGDRELTVFNRIQRKQADAMKDLKKNIENLEKNPNIREIFIIVNNHFAGFAPETANVIRKMLNIPFKPFQHQKSLTDYF
ncbi:MAG: DUF72 domain-containing protein [Promethearchaeota archaeon]|nr:MAG: DUF72 domain-containing protein [Candidatus Lokiarchaeota archaeon]